jgi:prepilin-type N-terminal cleavage/methylation domain-containing protein
MKFLRNQKGFTLIELIAVMIILGVMLIIIVPRYMDFDNHADQKMEQLQQNATDRYEVIRSTGMETGLDAEGNDVNESEGRLTKEK